MAAGPLDSYRQMLASGEIEPDPAQALAAEKLQLLANRLSRYRPPSRTDFLSYFTRRRGEIPEGLYLYGPVGRGKTMLMDVFFDAVPFAPKRRLHFHQFMAEVHERIAEARKGVEGDPIPTVARDIAAGAKLLCFDELHVTDIADAMILGRLFAGLLAEHVVVVATSNAAPRELYKDGLNRQLFLPFVDLIEDRMEVLVLDARKDFRREKLAGQQLYFVPADAAAETAMRGLWHRLTGVRKGAPASLEVKGRQLTVREAHLGHAWCRFDDLCAAALGAGDYLAIAQSYHTVLLSGVPLMGPEKRNEARRFIILVDTLYDAHVRLIVSADAEPDHLYVAGDGATLFQRTASRLVEMRSEAYAAGTLPSTLAP